MAMSLVAKEKIVIEKMIRLYCRHKEGNATLCADCMELLQYAHTRLDRCSFGDKKGSCRKCKIHCYKPEMRERIKTVMRYSGPRMLIYTPWITIRHWFK
nr:nitrous oxide-stimulated promoter family protein [Parabacteroides chinchillae]